MLHLQRVSAFWILNHINYYCAFIRHQKQRQLFASYNNSFPHKKCMCIFVLSYSFKLLYTHTHAYVKNIYTFFNVP
uniref:Uncharacterized protein n=1 Tax=Physcomitrium patens TaxID=3218 RepID=A0A2K1J892_PHYPA|nr:hypothetical protein PHYPA_020869 [Physcomitrium patens]